MKKTLLLLAGAAGIAALVTLFLRPIPPAGAPTTGPSPARPAAAVAEWSARAAAARPATLPATMDEALALADPAARAAAVSALAVRWLNTDRMSFLAYLEAAEVEDAGDETAKVALLLAGLADAFPKVDDRAAASPVYNDAVQKFVELWALRDPAAARAWVDQWLLGDARDQAAATLIGAMDDADEAQTLLDTIRQPYRRVEGTAALAALRVEQNPEAAFAWAEARPTPLESTIAVEKALSALAVSNPRRAADFLAVRSAKINADAAAALARAPRQPEPPHLRPRPGLEDVEPELTPQESIEARRRDQLVRLADAAAAIAGGLTATDLPAAQNWAATLPAGPVRTAAQDSLLATAAEADPAGAFRAYQDLPAASAGVAGRIFEQWAAADAPAAAAQVSLVRDPAARAAAVEGLAGAWAATDLSAAERWANARPAGAERDAAFGAVARAVSESEPQVAWTQALRIGDPGRRQAVLAEIFPDVVAENPEAARSLLAKADLPSSALRPLQRQVDGALKTTR